jgi:hypothetical protein
VFAVRCFIRPVTNQQQRYDALSQHLHGIWLPALVDYAYLPQGIRVRGQWYPVVRMAWIAGQQLHQYIEDHLRHSQFLERLAVQWRGVVAGLCGAHMAHGDLQHGNVLVDSHDQIHLVDYDGFFIPTLHTQPPGERGHPNYQHPERQQHGYYAANVDAFSALVIYVSLLALRTEPGLWSLHTGENLLFKAGDFTQPGRTPAWQRLQRSVDPEVQRLTATLEHFCRVPVSTLTDLDTVIQGLPERITVSVKARSAPTQPGLLAPPASSRLSESALSLPDSALDLRYGPLRRWRAVLWPGLVALLVVLGGWWWIQLHTSVQLPPPGALQERVAPLWRAGSCAQAETVLQQVRRRRPYAAEPYVVALDLLLQGGPCQQALGTREPVALLAEAIRTGVARSLPVLVEIDTAYGTTLTLRPEHLDTLARDQVTLKDGSRYRGTIKLKKG